MKLSKPEIKAHQEACRILEKDVLSFDEKVFVLENWKENATNINSMAGAFFTPRGLARDFTLAVDRTTSVVDLCAGIGMLSFELLNGGSVNRLVCVELNPDYVKVGKKIVPEADWICGSVLDQELLAGISFDQAISNPPFGRIKTGIGGGTWKYSGSEFEFKVIEVASRLAKYGAFILPQMSTPFRYSGERQFKTLDPTELPDKLEKFILETGIRWEFNCGIDTSQYRSEWNGVSPMCEICTFDFTEDSKPFVEPKVDKEIKTEIKEPTNDQLTLF